MIPSVAVDWYELGLELLDPKYEHELDIIEKDNKDDTKTCCRKMFTKWLNTDKLAYWDKLMEVLEAIGLDSVATDIQLKAGETHLSTRYIYAVATAYFFSIHSGLPKQSIIDLFVHQPMRFLFRARYAQTFYTQR